MQTDHVSVSAAHSATGAFYSINSIVLHMHHFSRLNYCTASMQCHGCHQQRSVRPTWLMSTGP